LHAAELRCTGVRADGDQNARIAKKTIERFGHVRVIGEIRGFEPSPHWALMQIFHESLRRAAFLK